MQKHDTSAKQPCGVEEGRKESARDGERRSLYTLREPAATSMATRLPDRGVPPRLGKSQRNGAASEHVQNCRFGQRKRDVDLFSTVFTRP